MKIFTVLGARPQFIKASVVSAAIANQPNVDEVLVHTGQHFDANMSDVFFSELGMQTPQYDLAINGGGHGEMTGRMLIEVEKVLQSEQPDVVLVYGDTNSTLAGALAAAKLHIPVAHVEAGLRSFNMRMPEEINRILTDRISRWLFAPTDEAVKHLRYEGIDAASIHAVGDVMYDVALHHGKRAHEAGGGVLGRLGLVGKPFVLATIHRAENTDVADRIHAIVMALIQVAKEMPVVWPLHPRTRAVLDKQCLLEKLSSAVQLIEPQGYLDMIRLEQGAAVIATDSGGVQKEAFFHQVPCVTLRDETEWVELVESGWNRLAPPLNADFVSGAILSAIGRVGAACSPYGRGDTAQRIVKQLVDDFAAGQSASMGRA